MRATSLYCLSARRVRGRLRDGSSSPVVVETSAGLFVAKLRGAGQGIAALVAEIIVAELAELLELPVPERALIELSPNTPSDDRNDELADLLRASAGTNVGLRLLEGAKQPRNEDLAALDDEFVARVLWLDGLTMNPDRTGHNPNIVLWKHRPWLIDHGAALVFHHRWADITEATPRESMSYTGHVFADRTSVMPEVDRRLAASLSREAVQAAVHKVPDGFLQAVGIEPNPERARAAYFAFFWKRLQAPRPFVGSGAQ